MNLDERIATVRKIVEAYEEAIIKLLDEGHSSYTVDTGQSRLTVTRHNIGTVQRRHGEAMNLLGVLEARRDGAGFYAGSI